MSLITQMSELGRRDIALRLSYFREWLVQLSFADAKQQGIQAHIVASLASIEAMLKDEARPTMTDRFLESNRIAKACADGYTDPQHRLIASTAAHKAVKLAASTLLEAVRALTDDVQEWQGR